MKATPSPRVPAPAAPGRASARAPWRSLVLLSLAAAALATARPLIERLAPAPASAQSAGAGPLPTDGRWTTFASGDRIQRIERDGDEAWAATESGGVVRWNLRTASFKQYLAPQDGLRSNRVFDVEKAPDGTIWAATERGLSFLPPGAPGFQTLTPAESPGMPARVVTALEPGPDGTLWVGFAQEWDPALYNPKARADGAFKPGGLARFQPATGAWDKVFHAETERVGGVDRYKNVPSENITELTYNEDGSILWIGTRQFLVYDQNACGDNECMAAPGYWVNAGGGLAAYDGKDWIVYESGNGGGCFADHITDIAADAQGRMWIGTAGRGLILMRFNMRRVACNTGVAYYVRGRKAGPNEPQVGLLGNSVWAVDVDEQGRVWIGNSDGYDNGEGIVVLDHQGTFEDSSANNNGFGSDDEWQYIPFDDLSGASTAIVSALDVGEALKLVGTRNHRHGGGYGIRGLTDDGFNRSWIPLRTGDLGLPSNEISDIRHDPQRGHTWVALRGFGVARFDGERWTRWRMFGPGEKLATITLDTREDFDRIKVNIPDQAAFDRLFPVVPAFVRIENDPTYYRVNGYVPERAGTGPFLRINPKLVRPVTKGTNIFSVYRGPASDTATQIDLTPDGTVWAGGRETVWMGNGVCPAARANKAQCWLDGGVSRYDGSDWLVYDIDNSVLPDQEVQAIEVDQAGRVWVGTGNSKSEGYGIAVIDPATDTWTIYDRSTVKAPQRFGGNGIADFSIDPDTGHVWVAHHPVVEWQEHLGGGYNRIFAGGGVSRFDGSAWSAWSKRTGAALRAYGAEGEMTAILADREHDLVWAGSWDADPNFHWLEGYGVHAALSWCPIGDCAQGWESRIWREDGKVAAMDLDAGGNVWVGTHRNGAGKVPSEGGVKVYNGTDWTAYTPELVPLVSNQISALAAEGSRMWVGTLSDGISVFDATPPETPTPFHTVTPHPATPTSPTDEPSATPTEPGAEPTPTSEGPTSIVPSPSATRTATPPRPTAAPASCGLGTDRLCRVFLPSAFQRQSCPGQRRCPAATSLPTPVLFTPTPQGAQPSATSAPVPSASPTTGAPPPSATATATEPGAATATATDTPDAPPSATPTERPASATPSPSPTGTVTAGPVQSPTPTEIAIRRWSIFNPTEFRLPTDDFFGVHGSGPNDVWFVGERGQVLHWDGTTMSSATVPTQGTLRSVFLVSPTRGYIAGDGGALLELRSRRWARSDTGSLTDDWKAVAAAQDADGFGAWVLGGDKGTRLRHADNAWAIGGPADRNTGHSYTALSLIAPTRAFATQNDGTGSRIYSWAGGDWSPGPATGPLFDIHARSTTEGMAVGSRGSVWALDTEGKWKQGLKPTTAGQDLFAVHIVAPDLIWAGGGRSGLYRFNGTGWVADDPKAVSKTIYDIWISADGSQGWAVGSDGLFLRYE